MDSMMYSVVAVVLCISAVSRPILSQAVTEQQTSDERRSYTIAFGDYLASSTSYFDENGFFVGFTLELIDEVCRAAQVDCRTVFVPWSTCWDSHSTQNRGGIGLLEGWYDACANAIVTVPRLRVFAFSYGYFVSQKARFYVKANSTFNTDVFYQKRIGFVDGHFTNEHCLVRETGHVLPVKRRFYFLNTQTTMDALLNDEVDAVFVIENSLGRSNLATAVGPAFKCDVDGGSMMSRKDSDFPAAWNKGFTKLVSSGRYGKLCKESMDRHATGGQYPIECVAG